MKKTNLEILKDIRYLIHSDELKEQYRLHPSDFTRTRSQPFPELIIFIPNLSLENQLLIT